MATTKSVAAVFMFWSTKFPLNPRNEMRRFCWCSCLLLHVHLPGLSRKEILFWFSTGVSSSLPTAVEAEFFTVALSRFFQISETRFCSFLSFDLSSATSDFDVVRFNPDFSWFVDKALCWVVTDSGCLRPPSLAAFFELALSEKRGSFRSLLPISRVLRSRIWGKRTRVL